MLFRANLTEANLTVANLSGAILTDATLTKAILARANLTDATLTEADLRGANLRGAVLHNANLTDADLTGVLLDRASLEELLQRSVRLDSVDLSEQDLSGMDLRYADTYSANLSGADLTGADLIAANLSGADLTSADLTEAKLRDAVLFRANLTEANLSGINLTGIDMRQVTLTGSFYLSHEPPRGIDLSSFEEIPSEGIHRFSRDGGLFLYNLHASLPLTGLVQNFGQQVEKGLRLAVESHRGGPGSGESTGLMIEDNQSTSADAEESIRSAADYSDVLAFIGGITSAHALNMGSIAGSEGLPLFTPSATTQRLDSHPYHSYVVKVAPLDNYQIELIKRLLLKDFGVHQIVLINENSAYGSGFDQGLSNDGSIQVVGRHSFPNGALEDGTELEAAVRAIETAVEAGARMGVLAVYDRDANRLLKRLAEIPALGNLDWILTDGATMETTLADLPPESASYQPRLHGLTPSVAPDLYTSVEFRSKFDAQFSQEPEWLSYYGYDTYVACATALERATEKTRTGIWNAVAGMSFEGATGRKWFDEKGLLQSAIYDLWRAEGGQFEFLGELRVKQPLPSSNEVPSQKTVSAKSTQFATTRPDLVREGFTYTLSGDDRRIGHVAGGPGENGSWLARSRDYGDGWVLVAYYEDAETGITDDGREFGFQEGVTYHLSFDMSRNTLSGKTPTGLDVLNVKVTSVCRYRDGDGIERFNTKDIVHASAPFAEWSQEGPFTLDIPIPYSSADPEGVICTEEDHRLNWEISLLNSAGQELTLDSVSITQVGTTRVENFMLH